MLTKFNVKNTAALIKIAVANHLIWHGRDAILNTLI